MPTKKGPKGTGGLEGKERIHVALDRKLLEWVERNMEPGGPFGSTTHAVEFALKHLMDEEEALRAACRENKITFEASVLWSLYQKALDETRSWRRS